MKFYLFMCIGLLFCGCHLDDIIGHKHTKRVQKEYSFYLWGDGSYEISIIEELNDETKEGFIVNLELDKIGFQFKIDTINIKFPYNVTINNLQSSNAMYVFGELDNNVLNPKRLVEGRFGKLNKDVNSIALFIDKEGTIL